MASAGALDTYAGTLIDPDDTVGVKDDVVRAQFYDEEPRNTSFAIALF